MEFWKMNGAGNDFIILDNRVLGASPVSYTHLAPFMRDSEKRNHCDSRREHIICFPAQNSARSPTRAYTYG